MSRLEIILAVSLTLSILINVGFFLYVRATLSRLIMISEELGDLQDMINSFLVHVQSVYEMETFYGDQTLQYLLEHAKAFSAQMDSFEYIYSLTDEEPQAPTEEEIEYDDNEN
jgi:hypothetical protein